MTQNREIELKLEVPASAADEALAGLRLNDGKKKRLVATYYDTPDRALLGRGISFRVRRSGSTYVQTIKVGRGSSAGLFNRTEWERAVPGDKPDLRAVEEAGLQDILDRPNAWKKLQPVFTVDVERTVWHASIGGGSVEVVRDRGSILAEDAREAITEVELELVEGSSMDLFVLARRMTEKAPARLGVLTKAERGYRLLEGRTGKPTKAELLELSPELSTAEAFATITQACLRHFRLNEPLIADRDAAALHQARVALRRLRSAISIFRDIVSDERSDAIRTGLRALAGTLGEARNLDVLLERLRAANDGGTSLDDLQRKREAAYDRALGMLASTEARLLVLDILEWAEVGAWRTQPSLKAAPLLVMPARKFAARVLDRFRRRVKKRGAGLGDLDAEARHRVRIEAKKLRYATEFFASLFDEKKEKRRRKSFLAALEELQSSLGALNDIATGEELARDLTAEGVELPVAIEDEPRLLRAAEAAHDRLTDAKRFWPRSK